MKSADRGAHRRCKQQQSLADKIACTRVIALLSILDMPQILIRQLNSAIVRKLRAKAAAEGVSAEEEARRILRRSLVGDVPSMPLIDFLRTMPDADDDSIFRRRKRKPRKVAL
jgi:plasmid stability protein